MPKGIEVGMSKTILITGASIQFDHANVNVLARCHISQSRSRPGVALRDLPHTRVNIVSRASHCFCRKQADAPVATAHSARAEASSA